jgi:hypothetical protein
VERSPATRQRSPWHPDEPMTIEGYVSRTARRNVHDGALAAIYGQGPMGWHLSISHRRPNGEPGRYPTWDEIAHARDEFLPADRTFVMKLPAAGAYVAAHPTTFHLVDEDTIVDALEGMVIEHLGATGEGFCVARSHGRVNDFPTTAVHEAAADVLLALRPDQWEATAHGLRRLAGVES